MAIKLRYDPILLCQDPAIGHDWDTEGPKWEAGPDLRRGRRVIYVHHRVMLCTRCDSRRVEVFEQAHGAIEKTRNRYRYSRAYKERERLSANEVRTQLWKLS